MGFHIALAALPARRHRDLVHLANARRPQAQHLVGRFRHPAHGLVVAVPGRVVGTAHKALLRVGTCHLAHAGAPQAVGQQLVPVLGHPLFNFRQAAVHVRAQKAPHIAQVE